MVVSPYQLVSRIASINSTKRLTESLIESSTFLSGSVNALVQSRLGTGQPSPLRNKALLRAYKTLVSLNKFKKALLNPYFSVGGTKIIVLHKSPRTA